MSLSKITSENFDKSVLGCRKPVLVDFNADWCGHCQMQAPILEEVASEVKTRKIVSVNIDDQPELAARYRVASIPCLVYFKGGEEIDRRVGLTSKADILKLLNIRGA